MSCSRLSLAVGGTLWLAGFGGAAAAPAAQWQDHAQQAQRALALGQYEEALREYSNAYGSAGPKELLLDIGQVYLRLEQPKEARTACQTYLNLVSDATPSRKATAERCIADAARTPTRPRVPPPMPAPAAAPAAPPTVYVAHAAPPAASPQAVSPQAAPQPQAAPPQTGVRRDAQPGQDRPFVPPPGRIVSQPPRPSALPPPRPTPSGAAPPPAPAAAVAALPPPGEGPVLSPLAVPPSPERAAPDGINPYSEYELCLHQQRAGNLSAARECYQRFLPIALRQGGLPESDIGPLMSQLTRFPEPAAVYPTPARQGERQRNAGLWGAGLSMWLCASIPPLVFGPLYASQTSGDRKPIFYSLMVPVLGPFISGIWLPAVSRSKDDARDYTVPWIVADGLTQVVGLTLFIIGIKPHPLPPRLARVLGDVRLTPYASGQGAGIAGSF